MGSLVEPTVRHYFDRLDPAKTGRIQASDAASFLRSSGIADTDLAVIWDIADRTKCGSLDLQGLAVAVKLVSLVQSGQTPSVEHLRMNVPAARFSGFAPNTGGGSVGGSSGATTPDRVGTPPSRPSRPALPDKGGMDGWVVSQQHRNQYESIFHSLNPQKGKLYGNKVKPILLKSGLHVGTLGQIWELSDVDKDGMLDVEEFSLAMYLLNKAREGEQPPTILPHNYIPPSHRVVYTKVQKVNWGVPAHTRKVASEEFAAADVRNAGQLTGQELRTMLERKGVPVQVLAKIWGLCDIEKTGKLGPEQYALALHLISLHKQGKLPEVLPVELIPPSFRSAPRAPFSGASPSLPPRNNRTATLPPQKQTFSASVPIDKTVTLGPGYNRPSASTSAFPAPFATPSPFPHSTTPTLPTSSIPDELASLNLGSALDAADFSVIKELDTYTKETDSLTKEKKELQSEIKAAEESLSTAGEELKDLKKQLASLEEEVQAARKQRDQVQARLDEAEAENRKYEDMISEVHTKAMTERQQISALQQQIASQDALRKSHEEELQKAREELQKLRQEESHYLHQVESGKRQLDSLIQNLRVVQSDTNMTQAKVVQIEAAHRTIDKVLAELAPFGKRGPGAEGKPSILTNIHELTQLRREGPDITQMSDITRATAGSSPISSMSGFSVDSYMETHSYETKNDAHSTGNPFGPPSSDPFQADVDPFGGNDPFKSRVRVGKRGESDSSGNKSGTNTPQMGRKQQTSSDSVRMNEDVATVTVAFSNPFEGGGEDPFKDSGFSTDPFQAEGNPFQGQGEDPFTETVKDPFNTSATLNDFDSSDPFSESKPDDPFGTSEDPFVTPSAGDPFGGANTSGEDPFASNKFNESDDPFKEKNLFASENDAFNTHDPFANTPDPFAGSADIFKGSNASLSSRSTRGSKNSLNNVNRNFGSKNSLRDSKTSLNEPSVSDCSPKLEPKIPPVAKPSSEASYSDDISKGSDQFSTAAEVPDPFANSATDADPFKAPGFESDPFSSLNGKDPFSKEDEKFASKTLTAAEDPFYSKPDPNDPFGAPSLDSFTAAFDEHDPFSSSKTVADPFGKPDQVTDADPFGKPDQVTDGSSVDPFKSDSNNNGAFAASFS